MSNPLRLLTIAAVIIFGTGSFAGAQTVMVRGAVPGETIEVRMRLPKVIDERSKELLREFGRINGESVRESTSAKATVDKQ